jgi:hypothetical protein
LGQLFGPVLGAFPSQPGFGVAAGGVVNEAGQLVVEAADHRDLPVAGSQVGGLANTSGGFGAAGQGPLGDRVGQFAAQFLGGGLAGQSFDQLMFGHR